MGQRMGSVEREEVLQNLHATLGGDGLGVELDTEDRELFMPETHNFALGGLGRDFEAVREAVALDQQRMVAGGE